MVSLVAAQRAFAGQGQTRPLPRALATWQRAPPCVQALPSSKSAAHPLNGDSKAQWPRRWASAYRPMDPQQPSTTAAGSASDTQPQPDPLIQYVVLRADLWTKLKWPLGSVAAQAAHAATAALWLHKDDAVTQQYCADLDHLRKVVLQVKDEAELTALSNQLTTSGILHKLWVEQPEDVPTSLATKPYPKSIVGPAVRKLQLCKAAVGK